MWSKDPKIKRAVNCTKVGFASRVFDSDAGLSINVRHVGSSTYGDCYRMELSGECQECTKRNEVYRRVPGLDAYSHAIYPSYEETGGNKKGEVLP